MWKSEAHDRFWRELTGGIPLISTISVTNWSRKERVIPKGTAYKPGKFEPYPMQEAPMDDTQDENVSEVILCWAAQTGGKNEVINSVLGFFIDQDPSPALCVLPTDKLAGDYSKERFTPMVRAMPCLSEKIGDPRTRDSGNTVLSKSFPGGSIAFVGANSPAGLAGRPRRVIVQDEIDRYPASAGTEGDPCMLADKRAEAFPNAVKLKTSTPTIKGRSRIWKLLELSDWNKWHARCPRCPHEQVFAWSQVGWPEDMPELAWIKCAGCGAQLTDAERVAAVRAGRWKASQRFRGIRGYWLNGINTLLKKHKGYKNRLHQMAAEFLVAKAKGKEGLRVWTNTFLCECWEEEAEAGIAPTELQKRAEHYDPDALPVGVLVVVGSIDVQDKRLELELVGYGKDEESWGIVKAILDGDPKHDDVWNAADDILLRELTREDGLKLKVERVFVDMQHKTKRVLEFCGPRLARGVYPCRGVNTAGKTLPPLLPAKPSRNNRARIPHWNVGVTIAKGMIYDRLELPVPGPRSCHFPQEHGYDAEHFKQLTIEVRKTRYKFGESYSIFEKRNDSDRNEALDLRVYATAALASLGRINWDKLAENRRGAVPKKPEPEAELAGAPVNRTRVPVQPNWVLSGGGW